MKYVKYKAENTADNDNNVFWVTMSDLLLGLVVVFLVLFVFAMTGFTQKKVEEHKVQYEVTQEIAQELRKNNIEVDVDKFSGKIKISDLELFELNSWELSLKGKQYLSKFVPVYLNTIMQNPEVKDKISQIIIEGHTDSQTFAGAKTPEEQYYKNMDLSLKRASSVAQYIVFSQYNNKKSYEKDLLKLLSVQGKSSSEPVFTGGKEDFSKSRRVELKIMFKDNSVLDAIKK